MLQCWHTECLKTSKGKRIYYRLVPLCDSSAHSVLALLYNVKRSCPVARLWHCSIIFLAICPIPSIMLRSTSTSSWFCDSARSFLKNTYTKEQIFIQFHNFEFTAGQKRNSYSLLLEILVPDIPQGLPLWNGFLGMLFSQLSFEPFCLVE